MFLGLSLTVWMGFIRHVLTAVGGMVVAAGWIDESTVTQAVGAIMTILGFLASWWAKEPVPLPDKKE